MRHDLGAQDSLDQPSIDAAIGKHCPSLLSAVMMRWRPTVSLSSTLDQDELCRWRANRLQDRWNLAPHFDRRVRIDQVVA